MDGNGRWAQARGLPRVEGHRRGAEAARNVVRACRRLNIPCVTLYAFSLENWARPSAEIDVLMNLLAATAVKEIDKLLEHDIRLRLLGRLERLPAKAQRALAEAVERTAHCRAMTLCAALSYSARDEIVRAAARLANEAAAGRLQPADLGECAFAAALDTAGLPDPDLLIRTGGERRLSNFLLWQAAYAELELSPVMWPDFGEAELTAALRDYAKRERRFGKTGEQVRGPGEHPA
jgi:undecaprenyl diphosphate synthase